MKNIHTKIYKNIFQDTDHSENFKRENKFERSQSQKRFQHQSMRLILKNNKDNCRRLAILQIPENLRLGRMRKAKYSKTTVGLDRSEVAKFLIN